MKDLYFLLIGFKETDAKVMQVLVDLSFPSLRLGSVQHQIAKDFQLSLPDLTLAESQYDALIIDLEGVGFFGEDISYAVIQQFINAKPALLLTRNEIKHYQALQTVNNRLLKIPYNREQMMQSLSDLIYLCQEQDFSTEQMVNNLTKSTGDFWESLQALQQQKENIQKLFAVLENTFKGIQQSAFFDLFYRLQLLQQTSVIRIGTYQLYINPKDKSVVSNRLDRIVDYIFMNATPNNDKKLFSFELLDYQSYEEQVAVLLMEGDRKITINQFIWNMGLVLVSRNMFEQVHTLQIKANLMPNLVGVDAIPSYVCPVIASCLSSAKTLAQIQTMFPLLTVAQINQVLILMIMSDIVDTKRLWDSFQEMKNNRSQVVVSMPQTVAINNNSQGVKKASSSGFLKRLLEKLSFGS